jgi:hypothetical protein
VSARHRCLACGKQFNERSGGLLNHAISELQTHAEAGLVAAANGQASATHCYRHLLLWPMGWGDRFLPFWYDLTRNRRRAARAAGIPQAGRAMSGTTQ